MELDIAQDALARATGMSRQHYSRLISGRAQLDLGELQRLARELRVAPGELVPEMGGQWEPTPDEEGRDAATPAGEELQTFVDHIDDVVHFLRNRIGGEVDARIRLAILDTLEDLSRETGNKLPPEYWTIRREVVEKAAEEERQGGRA